MDIVRFKGGLGNQMFQYALIEALRSKGRVVGGSLGFYKRNPKMMPFVLDKVFGNVDINEVEDPVFDAIDERWKCIKQDSAMRANFEKDLENRFFWVEETDQIYLPQIFMTKVCTFVGYWQTEKYFIDIRDKILERFTFTEVEDALREYGNGLMKNCVSVHVRRQDYLKFGDVYCTCSRSYYQSAMNYMKQYIPNARFLVFSDDVEWCRSNLAVDVFDGKSIFEDYQDWYDLYLMSQCKGNIIANSSFSWWGAWLNQNENHRVVAPDKWLINSPSSDIWCEGWAKIQI